MSLANIWPEPKLKELARRVKSGEAKLFPYQFSKIGGMGQPMSDWKFLPDRLPKHIQQALQVAVDDKINVVELEPAGLSLSYINILTERLHIFTIEQLLLSDPNTIMTRGVKQIAIEHIQQALLRFYEHNEAKFLDKIMPNICDLHMLRLQVAGPKP